MPTLQAIAWVRVGDCIECTSHKGIRGGRDYPKVSIGKRQTLLHRAICERRHGKLGKLFARHICDNPRCINPNHLIPGTATDNNRDRDERNRQARGARNGQAKISDIEALQIHQATGTHRQIAERFKVTHTTVGKIKRCQRWQHIHAN